MMAWLRTAIAMITFGFTLFKAVQYARQLGLKRTEGMLGPGSFALIMIVLGLLALIVATIQHIRRARTLRQLDAELSVFSVGTLLAVLLAGVGVFALISVLARD
jgi:putative membrane protein